MSNQSKPRGAAMIMQKMFRSGFYAQLKLNDAALEAIKDELKQRHLNKRREYQEAGVICKYENFKVYETNWPALNDYLDSLGILPLVVKFSSTGHSEDVKGVLEQYQNPVQQYIRITPNKLGRVHTPDLEYSNHPTLDLIFDWKQKKDIAEHYDLEMARIKSDMSRSRLLKKNKKLTCAFGSVSLLDAKPTFDVCRIYTNEGSAFLIEHGKVDMQELDAYVAMGFISHREINQFRKCVDIQSRFYVMTIEAELKLFDYYNRQLQRKIRLSRGIS